MNEKAINQVIADFAIENANLRVAVANLRAELDEVKETGSEEPEEEK